MRISAAPVRLMLFAAENILIQLYYQELQNSSFLPWQLFIFDAASSTLFERRESSIFADWLGYCSSPRLPGGLNQSTAQLDHQLAPFSGLAQARRIADNGPGAISSGSTSRVHVACALRFVKGY